MKRKFCLFITFLLLTLYSTSSLAASDNPITSSKKTVTVNGKSKSVNIVTIDLNNPNIKLEVVKGNNKISGAESFKSMIDRKKPLAAINGNFFDAYKTLEPYGSIIQNNKLIYLEGDNTSFSIFDNNLIHMDYYQIKINGFLDGLRKNVWNNTTQAMDFNTFSIWYVNNVPSDQSGVYLFTPERGADINLANGTAITVVDNIVTNISKNSGLTAIPKNGYLIYYAPSAAPDNYIYDRFKIGRSVELEYFTNIDESKSKLINQNLKLTTEASIQYFNINDANQMISAGPLLVKDGKIVLDAKKEGFTEAKINSNSAQRSALGITKDNKLIFVTTSMTMKDLASAMQSLGCTYAMNLDGGASSALYANGKIITPAGRNLNTTLMVLKK